MPLPRPLARCMMRRVPALHEGSSASSPSSSEADPGPAPLPQCNSTTASLEESPRMHNKTLPTIFKKPNKPVPINLFHLAKSRDDTCSCAKISNRELQTCKCLKCTWRTACLFTSSLCNEVKDEPKQLSPRRALTTNTATKCSTCSSQWARASWPQNCTLPDG